MKPQFLMLAITAAILAYACQPKEKTENPSSENTENAKDTVFNVKVEKTGYSGIERTEDYAATIKAWEEAHLGPAQPNQIEKIYVNAGDRVKKGDLLVQMDQTALIQAKIQFE